MDQKISPDNQKDLFSFINGLFMAFVRDDKVEKRRAEVVFSEQIEAHRQASRLNETVTDFPFVQAS